GAVLALKRPAPPHLPTAVSLPVVIEEALHPIPGQGGGFLGARYAPLAINGDPSDPAFAVDGLTGGETGRLAGRRGLLRAGDPLARAPRTADLDAWRRRAVELLPPPAARRAFDLGREPARLRQRYGLHRAGQSLLLARRLVEAGVRLVTVYWGGR